MRIGYVTNWGVQKNFDVLFRAIARLTAEGREVRLVLTLDPNLSENANIIAQAMAMGLFSVIENVGNKNATCISTLYDSLDIFVFPSLVESFGFPLVEAMTKGLPVVVADTGSNRELAGSAGQFFPSFDSEALAITLAGIMDDPSLLRKMSLAARERAQGFSWERAAEQTLALIGVAAGETGHGSTNSRIEQST